VADATQRLSAALQDRYAIERELGRGGMAIVYLARDLRHERPVALKLLRPDLAGALGPDRFVREIALTARLDHPHILPVFDSGAADGLLWYVMPYVQGESLRDRIRREGRLPVQDALRIAGEVADALEYAHRHGIVHRDVKPENILLGDGHARVADFGVARAVEAAASEELTATGLALGTPAYMAPEQAAGEQVDARADLYALACVLYEMLAGEPAFTGPTAQAIIGKRFAGPPPSVRSLRGEVPAHVDATIRRALARLPSDRFVGAADFARALHDPGLARSPRRAWRPAVLTAAAVLVAGLAWRMTAAHPAPVERVAVYPFSNRTGDAALAALGSLSADWIAQAIARVSGVELVTMPALMVDASLADPSAGERRDAVARSAGARTAIWGNIYRMRDSLRLVANVTDLEHGRLLATVEVATPATAPEPGIQTLSERVTTSVLATRSRDTTEMLMRSTRPPTFAAFQAFAEGMEWNDSSALSAFQRAAALDSTFLSPLVWIGFMYRNQGEYALADSVGSIAERQRERLSPFERAALERMLAEVRGDNEGAFTGSRRVLAAAPSSDWAKCVTAEAALWIDRPRVALRTLEGVDTRPGVYNGAEWCDLVPFQAWLMLDDGEHAVASARRFRAKWSDSPWAPDGRDLEAMALAHLGRLDQARVLAESTAAVAPASFFSLLLAHELRRAGDRATALTLLQRRAENLRRSSDTAGLANLGETLYWGGKWDEASTLFERLAGHAKYGVRAHGVLGVLAARREDVSAARAADDWLSAVDPRHRRGEVSVWRARIAAALGERERAVELLEQAFREGQTRDYFGMYGPGMAWFRQDPHFEAMEDFPPYHRLMLPRE
jgi:tRNA A-37 threonylcarbamoyl transferase component Bud32/tetratricopeptide (TPR) repeat protein